MAGRGSFRPCLDLDPLACGGGVFENGRLTCVRETMIPTARGGGNPSAATARRFGTNHELVRYANGAARTTTEDGLAGDDGCVIIKMAATLVDRQHGGLSLFERAQFRLDRMRRPAQQRIRALYLDRDGVLWIGTSMGASADFRNGTVDRHHCQKRPLQQRRVPDSRRRCGGVLDDVVAGSPRGEIS
jgi:hypothetical protein